jgi:cytochrome c oxidase subunit 1
MVEVDDPWGWGRSLEWATSCPPPRHNFDRLPRIRSESPAFDLHHPEVGSAVGEPSGNLLDHVFGAADQDPSDPAAPATTPGSRRAEED